MTGGVLVTGGAGYIGSVLVGELLATGRPVRVLDSFAVGNGASLLHVWGNERFEFMRADVRDAQARSAALRDVEVVVHLAALVGDPACARAPEEAAEVNLEATRALAADAAAAGVGRFVFASTCSNYGKMDDPDAYATEAWQLRPVSLYAETKVAAELDLLARTARDFAPCCLRFATVYGASPRMRFDLTVNEFVRDAFVTGELVVYGEQFWRPYVHVRDAVRALTAVVDAPVSAIAGEVFNVGSTSENLRKRDLVALITERLPQTTVRHVGQVDDPRDYRVAFEKVFEQVGFSTTRSVADGVEEILALLRSGTIADPFAPVHRN